MEKAGFDIKTLKGLPPEYLWYQKGSPKERYCYQHSCTFKTDEGYKRHINECPTLVTKEYVCTVVENEKMCGLVFSFANRLTFHVYFAHGLYLCDRCGTKHSDEVEFNEHQHTHQNSIKDGIRCLHCPENFNSFAKFKLHVSSRHRDNKPKSRTQMKKELSALAISEKVVVGKEICVKKTCSTVQKECKVENPTQDKLSNAIMKGSPGASAIERLPILRRSERNKPKPKPKQTLGFANCQSKYKKYKYKPKKSKKKIKSKILVQVQTIPSDQTTIKSTDNNTSTSTANVVSSNVNTTVEPIVENVVSDPMLGLIVDQSNNVYNTSRHRSNSDPTIDQNMHLMMPRTYVGMENQPIINNFPSTSNNISTDVRNDMYSCALAKYTSEIMNANRFGSKYRSNMEPNASFPQYDSFANENYSNRLSSDTIIDASQPIYTNVSNLALDGSMSNLNRLNVATTHMPHTSVDYFNQPNYGAYQFAHNSNMGTSVNENYYTDPLFEERRRRNSMIDTYMVDRSKYPL